MGKLAALLAALKEILPALKQGFAFAAGMVVEMLRYALLDAKEVTQAYKEILDEERKLDDVPVAGAAERLRKSKFNRDKA